MSDARAKPRRRAPRRTLTATAAAALAVVAACLSSFAQTAPGPETTLADYRERVRACALALDSLVAHEESAAGLDGEEEEARAVADVRATLAPRQRISLGGRQVEVDNSWLHESLDAFQRETNARDRAHGLAHLAERLFALAERLAELEAALQRAAPRDKEAEKGRLAAILRRPEFNQTPDGRGALARVLEQIVKWLRD
ncbi:MAG TPA: hypothetical protein VEQ42_01070, partial [Pyrinomonadaceae bacterium]|nr:hypothetical protein [Pyrinomonadaceae bacterium]